MSIFTEDQAKASKLESSNREFNDGNFAYWVLIASGSDGQYHQFIDHKLAEDASLSAIKARMVGHLTGSNYYVAPTEIVVSGSVEFSGNVGDTLG